MVKLWFGRGRRGAVQAVCVVGSDGSSGKRTLLYFSTVLTEQERSLVLVPGQPFQAVAVLLSVSRKEGPDCSASVFQFVSGYLFFSVSIHLLFEFIPYTMDLFTG